LARLLPPQLADGQQIAVRFLHKGDHVGRVSVLFQRHGYATDKRHQRRVYGLSAQTAPALSGSWGISYLLAGHGCLQADRGEHPLQTGHLFQLSSHQHFLAEPGCLECCLYMDGETAKHLAACSLLQWEPRIALVGPKPALLAQFLQLYEAIADHTIDQGRLLRQALQMLDDCDRRFAKQTPMDLSDQDFATRAKSLLREHPQPGYPLRHVAAELGLSYSHFRRRFTNVAGQSPGRYHLQQRIHLACSLLRQHTIVETAELLGYSDRFCFANQFKQVMGMTPGQFRT